MQIIQVKENQKEIWNKFVSENNSESFLQAWEWGEFQKSLGRKIWRVGIVDNGEFHSSRHSGTVEPSNSKLLAVALIVKYDLPFGRSYLYCPRGPVIKISNIQYLISNILNFLFSEIKKIAKEERSLFLRIDPPIDCWFCNNNSPVEPKMRDLQMRFHSPNGTMEPSLNCLQTGSTVPKRRELWSQHNNLKKSLNEIQPRNTLILDLTKSEEELLKEMKQKTRYNIRLAGRKSVDIGYWILDIENQKYFKEKFEEFWKLVEETSRRDKFSSHSKNYYWKMLKIGVQDTRNKNQKNINNQATRNKQKPEGDIGQCRLRAKLYLAEYQNKIIAANVVLYFGDYCVYLHGASSNENRNMMAPYLLQWRQIIDAKKAGCKKYDFWGVNSVSWSGITKFKKGFGGFEKKYIGAYDLVFDNIGYPIYRFARKARSLI